MFVKFQCEALPDGKLRANKVELQNGRGGKGVQAVAPMYHAPAYAVAPVYAAPAYGKGGAYAAPAYGKGGAWSNGGWESKGAGWGSQGGGFQGKGGQSVGTIKSFS